LIRHVSRVSVVLIAGECPVLRLLCSYMTRGDSSETMRLELLA
jgi:hypothetical protein